jgi:hypothetical protein
MMTQAEGLCFTQNIIFISDRFRWNTAFVLLTIFSISAQSKEKLNKIQFFWTVIACWLVSRRRSPKKSVIIYQRTRRPIPEVLSLCNHRFQNLKISPTLTDIFETQSGTVTAWYLRLKTKICHFDVFEVWGSNGGRLWGCYVLRYDGAQLAAFRACLFAAAL